MGNDKIAMFKTKEEVLSAMGRGDVGISEEVLKSAIFTDAANKDMLGFIAESGSDYTITEIRSIKNNPKAFLSLAFGSEVNGDTEQSS